MDTSPKPAHEAAARPERDALCPEHGTFLSRNIYKTVWSKCPECERIDRDAREAQESVEAHERAERAHRAMMDAVRIPTRFERCSFDNFIADTPGKLSAQSICRDFAESFAEHSARGASLILSGAPGTGKSHLAGAVLRALLSDQVRYTTCMDMIRAVRETWRKDSEKSETQLLTYFERLDLLVVDEVGMQYGTDGEQTILFDVLDRRYRELKSTILITNQDKEGFKGFVGERVFDRLRETSRWVPFDWQSYRAEARKAAA